MFTFNTTFISTSLLTLLANVVVASPVGLWKSVDDATGRVKSHVRISQAANGLTGVVEKVFAQDGKEQVVNCTACTDARKDKPIIGMQIMSGYQADPENKEKFIEGRILDPENGKEYKSFITLKDGGKRLEVRGFIGTPMLGRSQTWQRAE